MHNKNKVFLKDSISVTLLKSVFGIYVIIALVVTSIHMLIDYNSAKKMIHEELKLYQTTFESIIGNAVWHMNQEHMNSAISSILKLPSAVGVSVIDAENRVLMSMGTISETEKEMVHIDIDGKIIAAPGEMKFSQYLFWHESDIIFAEDSEHELLGRVIIYSNTAVVFQRVKYGYVMLIVNAIIKTIALWIIFILFARILLKRPLELMTTTASQLDVDSFSNVKMDIKTTRMNEFKVLEITFNKLLNKLNKYFLSLKKNEKELQVAKEELEHRVEVRTKELINAEKYVSNIIHSMADTLIVINFDKTITSVNRATLDLLGYEESEIVGESLSLILGERGNDLTNILVRELNGKNSVSSIETSYTTKNGIEIPVLFSGSVLHDEKNIVHAIVCVAQNISERIQAENQIKASLNEKEILLKEIHHRVKNNMTVISSLLKLQSNSTNDDKIKDILKESQNRVFAMSAVYEMLHSSDNLSKIDLNTYLSKITNSIFQTYTINQAKVKFSCSVEDSLISISQAYPLGLIINELISNSLKYAFPEDRKGEISVSMKKQGSALELIVMDDGIGIPKDFNWKNSKSLGLKLVTTLVENQLDGTIDMENKNGTNFIIKFNIET